MAHNNTTKAPRSIKPEGGDTSQSLVHRERILEFTPIALPPQVVLGDLGAVAVGLFSYPDRS
jgi:hypothetical protein